MNAFLDISKDPGLKNLNDAVGNDYGFHLRKWKEIKKRFEPLNLLGSQRLDEAYIIEKFQNTSKVKILIANEEGRLWYDKIEMSDIGLHLNLGMARPGSVVFDCGANQGIYSLAYAQAVGDGGKVHAFDPFPLNAEIIRFNIELNENRNIIVHEVGLSNQEREIVVSNMYQIVADSPNASKAQDAVTLKLKRLDSFASLKPDFLKIDIEGAEVDALEGAQEIIAQRPHFQLETHANYLPQFNRSMMEIFKYISLEKFTCYAIYPDKGFIEYQMEFELKNSCNLYFCPKEKPPIRRYYTS